MNSKELNKPTEARYCITHIPIYLFGFKKGFLESEASVGLQDLTTLIVPLVDSREQYMNDTVNSNGIRK